MPFYARLCPYLCGMMTSYILHTKRGAVIKFSKHLNTSLWLVSISVIFAVIIGVFPFHSNDSASSNFAKASVRALSHLGWSVSVAWMVFACHCGSGGFVNRFLSLPMWKPLSRLGLSIYLTHILAVLAIFGTQKQPAYFNEFLKTHLYLGDLGLAFGVAVLAFLSFEASVLAIEKSFHPKKDEK